MLNTLWWFRYYIISLRFIQELGVDILNYERIDQYNILDQ